MGMKILGAVAGIGIFLLLLWSGWTAAVTDITEGADVQADPETVKAIVASFDRAEEALRTENLAGVMAIYSKAYRHRGLRKEDTSRIWEDIFVRYDRLSSRHFFSKIVVDSKKGTALVICTGTLYGLPVPKKEEKPAPGGLPQEPIHIDIWFDANHYLILENGTWRIIGHDPTGREEDSLGASIHLLF
jgi:hypothetical protein